MKIVFMGTPDFAVPSLARILQEGHTVSAVFTQPDRPKGRGKKLAAPAVKEFALQQGLTVHQPTRLRDGTVERMLRDLAPDVIVVVAYGRLLPPAILDIPPLGCINVHASLLPKLRGAAPVQRSIINGDTITGVTTMYMAEGLDTGDMILQRKTFIGDEETGGGLFSRISQLGADILADTLPLLEAGTAPRIPQDHAEATHAPMIEKSMALLDFTRPATELCNLIRGLNPSPLAFLRYSGGRLKVHTASVVEGKGIPGEVLDEKKMIVACGEGALRLLVVQPEGKRPMKTEAFVNSGKVRRGEIFIFDSHTV